MAFPIHVAQNKIHLFHVFDHQSSIYKIIDWFHIRDESIVINGIKIKL